MSTCCQGPREKVPRGRLRRQDPERRKARRSANRAADAFQAGHQPQDRQSPQPIRSALAGGHGRRGHRVRRGIFGIGHEADVAIKLTMSATQDLAAFTR